MFFALNLRRRLMNVMQKKFSNILKYILSLLVAAALLYFSFRDVNWSDFMGCLKTCRWEFILLSMLSGALVPYVRAVRWRMLLLPVDRSTSTVSTWNAYNICMLTNIVLPRAGELVRCGYITKNSGRDGEGRRLASYDKVLGTVVTERVWDILMIVFLVFLLLTLMWNRFGAFFQETIFPSLTGKLALWWIVALLAAVLALLVWAVWRFRDSSKLCGRIFGLFKGVWEGLCSFREIPSGGAFLFSTLVIWLLYWAESCTVLWSMQGVDTAGMSAEMTGAIARIQELGVIDALFLMFAGALSSLVPVPGGFGAFHTVVAGALASVYGIPFSVGLIFATLNHESQALVQILLGVTSFGWESVRK